MHHWIQQIATNGSLVEVMVVVELLVTGKNRLVQENDRVERVK